MVQNPCLSKSHTKFGLQDHPCFRILLAWDKYQSCTFKVLAVRSCFFQYFTLPRVLEYRKLQPFEHWGVLVSTARATGMI